MRLKFASLKHLLQGMLPFLALFGCQNDNSHPVSRFERDGQLAVHRASPAVNPAIFPEEQKELFLKLSPGTQTLFVALTPEQRSYALSLTNPVSPDDALWKSALQSILELDIPSQKFYNKLNKKNRILFVILDESPTKAALDYAETMSPDRAVHEALKLEIDSYPRNLQNIINNLSPDKQALFLTLSDATQSQIFNILKENNYDAAAIAASQIDIKRLPAEEQAFITLLSPDEKTLFLALPPENKAMAILLTKKLDLNLIMQYAASIQTEDGLNNRPE